LAPLFLSFIFSQLLPLLTNNKHFPNGSIFGGRMKNILDRGIQLTLALSALGLAGCSGAGTSSMSGGNSSSTSVSEIAASSVAGAANASDSNANTVGLFERSPSKSAIGFFLKNWFEPMALATNYCPVAPYGHASTGTVSGAMITLAYSGCAPHNAPLATWNGTQTLTFDNSTTLSAYEAGTATSGTVTRTFAGGVGTTAGTITASSPTYRTAGNGTVVYMDSTTADVQTCYSGGDGNGDCASHISAGGETTTFGSGTRTMTINGMRVVGAVNNSTTQPTFDHTVYMPSALTISGYGASKVISSGSITIYHNRAKYKAVSTITQALTWSSVSCHPSSGQITTTCPAGSANATETFTYSSATSATVVDCSGNTTTVTPQHCL
jgi:hypothetical protein